MGVIDSEREKILKKRKKETEKKKKKPSVYELPMFQKMPRPSKNREKNFSLTKTHLKNNPAHLNILNTFIQKDSRKMDEIQYNTVSLIITSPPYNVDKSNLLG